MSITEPRGQIATYLTAANAQNIDAVTACFNQSAVVHDEKRDQKGIAAIRKWATEVSEKYHPMLKYSMLRISAARPSSQVGSPAVSQAAPSSCVTPLL